MTGIPQEDFEQEIELWLLEHPAKDEVGRSMAGRRACQRMARKAFGIRENSHWKMGGESDLDLRKRAEQDWYGVFALPYDSPHDVVEVHELWSALAARAAAFQGPKYRAAALALVNEDDDDPRVSRQIRHLVRFDLRATLAAILQDQKPARRYEP